MFFIGIFSSHIPYLLLAIVYMASMPVLIFQKDKDAESTLDYSYKRDVLDDTKSMSMFYSYDCFNFSDSVYSISRARIISLKKLFCDVGSCLIIRQFSSCNYTSDLYRYPLSSRPPPLSVRA